MPNATTLFLDEQLAAGRGRRTALITPRGSLTYEELYRLTCRVGARLRALGVRPEERVALLLHDTPAFVAAFFGAMRIGAVAVPLSTRLTPDELVMILADCRAGVLIADGELLAAARGRLGELASLREVMTCGPAGDFSDADPPLPRAAPLEPMPMSGDDFAFWLYTSGTTGQPKAAVHLHRDLPAWRPYGEGVLRMNENDVAFATSRVFFAYALANAVLSPLASGASTYLYPHWPDPGAVAKVLEKARPTVVFSVPTMYARLLRAGLPAQAFTSARCGVSSGERLPAELHVAYRERFGLELIEGMGTSETMFMVFSSRLGASRPGSCGQPVPGSEVRLLDRDGREAGPDEEGVLHVRCPSASPFYLRRVERSRRAFLGEWFRTGDLFTRDEAGYYSHRGREDDLFKVAGLWVSPADVEAALLTHPKVAEAGVVGVEEAGGLVKGFAFVVPRDPAGAPEALAAELRGFAEARLAPHQRPRTIQVVSELPRTATGKLQRYRLREGAAHAAPVHI